MTMNSRKMNNYSLMRVSTVLVLTFVLVVSTFSIPFAPRTGAETIDNNPPYVPSDPDPENESMNISILVNLSWIGGDPDGDPVTYDVYFGETSPPELVAMNHSETNYDPGTLNYTTPYYWKIIAWDDKNESAEGPQWEFTTQDEPPNNPPYEPHNESPKNGSMNVAIDVTLSWVGGDPDGDPVTYDVYFGETSPPELVAMNHSETNYDPGTLNYTTPYYWKIIAWDDKNESAEGPQWEFTTQDEPPNNPPYEPHNESPKNGSMNVAIDVTLSWVGGDPDEGDTVLYDIFFGTSITPPKVKANHSSVNYNPGPLQYDTLYYWRIVAWDNHGASTAGPLWKFSTIKQGTFTVTITKPLENKFYFNDQEILDINRNSIVYGPITITAEVSSDIKIEKVLFYADGKLLGEVTQEPYEWPWRPIIQFNNNMSLTRTIKVVAVDENGGEAKDEINITKWRFHILPWLIVGGAIASRLVLHTTVTGFFYNFKESPISVKFYAIHARYRTVGPFKTQRGVINFKQCSGGFLIGPMKLSRFGPFHRFAYGSFTFIGNLHIEKLGLGQAIFSRILQPRGGMGGTLGNVLNIVRAFQS